MNDKLDHFVLEYDHESGTALLAMTEADGGRIAEGGTLPYAVARGYDADARTWESIEPFDDVTHAKLRFEKECGRYSLDADKIGDSAITVRDLEDVGCREVYVEDFTERPDEVRFFLRTDADAYMFGSSLGKSLTVQYTGKEDIAPALREVRAYCKDAAEKRDPCLIGAMAQASAAKSATAEGEAGGKKL